MNDKAKHFLACFLIALIGFIHSTFAGLYGATLCAILREYDRGIYTGKLDKKDTFLDLISDAFGIATAVVIWGIT
jgi:hypothetical protein